MEHHVYNAWPHRSGPVLGVALQVQQSFRSRRDASISLASDTRSLQRSLSLTLQVDIEGEEEFEGVELLEQGVQEVTRLVEQHMRARHVEHL